MTSYLLTPPAVEPLTLAETKTYLRLDHDLEDAFISTLIGAARLHVEGITGRALINQTWRVLADDWPVDGQIKLPVAPFRSLANVQAYDDEGAAHSINLAQFQPETDVQAARLIIAKPIAESPVLRDINAVEIDYVAGFGDAAEDVPADLRRACLSLVGYWFEHRDAVFVAGSGAVVPSGFDELLNNYRAVRL